MEVKVGETYKCGKNKVKVVHISEIHITNCRYSVIGYLIENDSDGGSCLAGFFSNLSYNGVLGYCGNNPEKLRFDLEPLVSPEKQSKLDKISEMEKQLLALKQEVEKEQ